MAKSKEPIWTPPEDVVRELLDAAAEKIPEDAIYPADTVKPAAEPLRDLVNGYLAFMAEPAEGGESETVRTERFFACLKAALFQGDAELVMRTHLRKLYQREEERAEERLSILKAVAWEMLEAYGSGEKLVIHTPLGDLRRQQNSQKFVWVDENRIDEIPEKLGEFQLVRIKKEPSKTGIGAYLEDLDAEIEKAKARGEKPPEKPTWAEVKPPGWHLRFS